MKHYTYKLILVALALFTASCTSTKYFSIDVRQPAHISFPENIVNIGIVDNAGIILNDSIYDSTNTELELITSHGKEIFKNSLTQFMNEEKYFNNVTVYPKATRTDKKYGQQLPLLKNSIVTIAKEMDADAIVSIDVYETKANETMISLSGFIYSGAQCTGNVILRTYDSGGNPIGPTILASDSILWIGDKGLIYDREAYSQLALRLSEGLTKQLIPYWESQQRWYYNDGTKAMKTAKKYVEKGEWAEAAKVWGAAFEESNENMRKAKLASNIAVANENLGDIENAATWVRIATNHVNKTSSRTVEYQNINWYKIKLLEREQNNPKVLHQLGAEEVEIEE